MSEVVFPSVDVRARCVRADGRHGAIRVRPDREDPRGPDLQARGAGEHMISSVE